MLSVVNVSNEDRETEIELQGISRLAGTASLSLLTSASQDDVNTLEEPAKVAPITQLIERYELPVLSVHAPSLFWMQLIGGRDAQVKLEKSAELAATVGATSVVVHPPFRWESSYAKNSEPNVMVVLAARSVSMTIPDLADAISGIGSSVPVAVAAAGT